MTRETLGQNIKRRRQALGWTTYDLEEKSGISNATISRIETGNQKTPRAATIIDILAALDQAEEEKAPTFSITTDEPFKKVQGLLQAGFKVQMTYDEKTDLYHVTGFSPSN